MAVNKNDYDIGIVGAGISGLTLAVTILEKNPSASILLLERSGRVGGRILNTESINVENTEPIKSVDLGGAWIWPSSMPFTMKYIKRYNIPLVQQEGSDGTQMRVKGGITLLVQNLLKEINCDNIGKFKETKSDIETKPGRNRRVNLMLNSMLVRVEESKSENKVCLYVQNMHDETLSTTSSENNSPFTVKHLVITAPPAKLAEEIKFDGSETRYITKDLKAKMKQQPIWMASVGKLALSYKEKFWKADDIMISLRPSDYTNSKSHGNHFSGAFQVYDAGVNGEGEHTVVAFVTCGRREQATYTAEIMAEIVSKQLDESEIERTNSTSFSKYESRHLKCWRTDKNINKVDDDESYPVYPNAILGLNDDTIEGRRIWFGGSEASENWTGMIEGAVMNGNMIGEKIANFQ